MAYPKITVNTGLALQVIASDTIPIPAPDLPQITGTNTSNTADKLVDLNANFSTVSIGDIVYNTATNAVATVDAVDSNTILELSANIFTNAPNDTYIVFVGGPHGSARINSSEGCLLYVGSNVNPATVASSAVDVKVKTTAGSIVTFTNFPVGEYLPVQVLQLYATGTDAAADNNCIAIW
jgi:hypothetical protein|tara:strand:+ start:909 stop:1448 length:540 start_codon:yes stop_codon:yes gene_type:complete